MKFALFIIMLCIVNGMMKILYNNLFLDENGGC